MCGGTELPRCRGNSCGAASTGVCFPFSSSHDLHRFLPRVCLLNSLPRRTCLSFPPFLPPPLSLLPSSPTAFLSLLCHCGQPAGHSPQSVPTRAPGLRFHWALRQIGLLFLLPLSRQVALCLCLVEALCGGEETWGACPAVGSGGPRWEALLLVRLGRGLGARLVAPLGRPQTQPQTQ